MVFVEVFADFTLDTSSVHVDVKWWLALVAGSCAAAVEAVGGAGLAEFR